ncbi:MAG: short-chain fatty acid transporter [Phycisphaera sp.]|nr:MAG: short-chain fatty acid transporter [Phycisphaera sp.]
MLARIGDRISAFFRATAPDPFVIAVLLTALTFVLALVRTDASPGDLVAAWSSPGDGVWKFLAFSMQMCLILVTGHVLASSKPVSFILGRLAELPRTGAQAAAMVAIIAAALGTLNWGLGLIAGAIIARDTGRSLTKRNIEHHYPVLVAAGYLGLMVWHGGFSGTAPLKISTEAEIASVLPSGTELDPISIGQTILSPMNMLVTGGLLVICPIVMALLMPKTGGQRAPAAPDEQPIEEATDIKPLLPKLLEDTPIVNVLLAVLIGAWAIGFYFPENKPSGLTRLTPNDVNLTVLMLGLILHGTPRSFINAVEEGARGCAGIIIQFPLYAGIMGMMHSSGLTSQIAELFAGAANERTLAPLTCVSAGIVNLFVPSGGGQWGVQGPIVVESALASGVPLPKAIMALAYGDQLTNMLQPFWALPLLAITGAKAREIVGYTAIVMIFGLIWTLGCLFLL